MKPPYIDINEFNYELPDERIAKYPLDKRSDSKLLYYNNAAIKHTMFNQLPQILTENTQLIFNNTKVIHARLHFKKNSGAEIEIFLLHPHNNENAGDVLQQKGSCVWHCMVGNKKRFKEEDTLTVDVLTAKWLNRENNLIEFEYGDVSFASIIEKLGSLPIPPYLNRATEEIDISRYQTSFAVNQGSVAAPTAALHFDEEIKDQLLQKNIQFQFLTLHVGAGTFKPVSTDNAIEHTMHEEYIVFTKDFIESLLNHTDKRIAVGTTSLRSLESLYWFGVGLITESLHEFYIPQYFPYEHSNKNISVNDSLNAVLGWLNKNKLQTLQGSSSIYIVPGYVPKMVNGIITNFHQPKSTLLLLISALVGNNWKNIYNEAMDNDYRFLSYGDSSLLLF